MSTSSLCRLSQLHEGETATVDHLNLSGPIRRRLHDLGLIEGTKVRCLYKSAWQDPVAIRFVLRSLPCATWTPAASLSAQTLAVEVMKMPFLKSSFSPLPAADADLTIALAGQPKRRQEQHLHALTGMHQHTGNWLEKPLTLPAGLAATKACGCAGSICPGPIRCLPIRPRRRLRGITSALNSTMPSW